MGLKELLMDLSKNKQKSMPQEDLNALKEGIAKIAASGLEKSALKSGNKITPFELKDALGKRVSSDTLLKIGPLVISFYRGGWCPYCNLELKALQSVLPDIESANATLIAISPELPDNSLSTAEKNKLKFPVLSDPNNYVARNFGIAFKLPEEIETLYKKLGIDLPKINGTNEFELPVPATFVAGTDGIIRYAYVNIKHTERAEPAEIIEVLRKL